MRHLDPFFFRPEQWPGLDSPEASEASAEKRPEAEAQTADSPVLNGGDDEPAFLDQFGCMLMAQSAYHEARDYFAARQPEAACLLLGPKRDDNVVTQVLIDDEGKATPASFTLAATSLNRKLKPYLAADLDVKGIWHLHPAGFTCLSYGDLLYVRSLFLNPKNCALGQFFMPITAAGRFYGFAVERDGSVLCVSRVQLVLF